MIIKGKVNSAEKINGVIAEYPSMSDFQTKEISDPGGYFTNDSVEDALQEIGAAIMGIDDLIGSGNI